MLTLHRRRRTAAARDRRAGSPSGRRTPAATPLALAATLLAGFGAGAQDGAGTIVTGDAERARVAAAWIGDAASTRELLLESLQITVELPSGKTHPGYLITAHDPESGLFWWTFQGAGPSDPEDRIANLPAQLELFVSEQEILGIELGTAPPALWILRSTSRAGSLADARTEALARVAASAGRIEEGTARWMRVVSLANALPRDFYYRLDQAMPPLEMKVTALARREGGWTVTLAGREGRVARVLLDDRLDLESAAEL